MKTSASSCLKVISCSCVRKTGNDLPFSSSSPEAKRQGNKRRWSFRRKSACHHVLSNTVIAETLSSVNKGSLEPVDSSTQKTDSSVAEEKLSVVECADVKLPLPVPSQEKVPETDAVEDQKEASPLPEDSRIIALQTAIRMLLAKKEFQKRKNVVLLQAFARGHIVRQHARGSLRCVQAIIKMQSLLRARISHEKFLTGDPTHEKVTTSSSVKHVSLENLLSNRFACQLMKSGSNNKSIRMICDPTKPGSASNWLERWTSVSHSEPSPKPDRLILDDTISKPVMLADEKTVEKDELKSKPDGDINVMEKEENLIVKNCLSYDPVDVSDGKESLDTDNLKNLGVINQKQMEKKIVNGLESEVEKNGFGTRKATNPSFVAAQSMFEKMSSSSNANLESVPQKPEIVSFQNGDSECGTELFVTSTVDSPDAYDADDKTLVENINNGNSENLEAVKSATDLPADQSDNTNSENVKDSVEEESKAEKNANSETGGLEVYNGSQLTSPSSYMTVSESQGTPSSQVSRRTKNKDRTGSKQRRKLLYASRRATSFPASEGKRQNFFGSPKPDQNMQRNSDGSSSSLPHFMQATESAIAKINANYSPRSSPDVQDKEFTKKRHSIPGANGRQDSPRMKRVMSQGQQGSKAVAGFVVHEKKWQR